MTDDAATIREALALAHGIARDRRPDAPDVADSMYGGAIAALSRLTARLDAERWQPIETAPRDGTRILSCDPGLGERSVLIAHWGAIYHAAGHRSFGWLDDYNQPQLGWGPTTWRPLPTLSETDNG